MKRMILLFIFVLVISSCIAPNEEIVKNAIAATELAEIKKSQKVPTATLLPTEISISIESYQEEIIINTINHLIENVPEGSQTPVYAKYIDGIVVEISDNELLFTLYSDTISEDEILDVSFELITAGMVMSEVGYPGDWGLTTIELINPGPLNSSASFFIKGRENLLKLEDDTDIFFDLLELDIDWGDMPHD
jgi:hypothetical protein